MTFKTGIALIGMMGALVLPIAAQAQQWDHRDDRDRRMEGRDMAPPGYLQALSDLRTAYSLVSHHERGEPERMNEDNQAAREIMAAYDDLLHATEADGGRINRQPPADQQWGERGGRVHRAMDLLQQAQTEINSDDPNPRARELRDSCARHINDAQRWINAVIQMRHY